MKFKIKKNTLNILVAILIALFLLLLWGIFLPKSFTSSEIIIYEAQDGAGEEDIARDLENHGIISSSWVFRFYALISGQHSKLQAGLYDVSPSMSISGIVNKLASGKIAKQKLIIFEGWDIDDIAKNVVSKKICTKEEFLKLTKKDFSEKYNFLKSKPKDVGLEGYLFPDTYKVAMDITCEDLIKTMLSNFGNRLTSDLRTQIAFQKKTIFQVVIMASILEKEVRSLEDKKIVAGILWKRITNGMPLQIDATVNYITGKSDPSVAIKDTRISSPYNTYKNVGLPKGPISNPGMESIMAAIYPTKTPYWYFLSAFNGKTIFSKTFKEHSIAITKYLSS